jgi:hypothetical protein
MSSASAALPLRDCISASIVPALKFVNSDCVKPWDRLLPESPIISNPKSGPVEAFGVAAAVRENSRTTKAVSQYHLPLIR